MLPRFLNALHNAQAIIRIQWAVIALLGAITFFAVDGLRRAPSKMDLHIPPDLSAGAVVRPGEVQSPNVYAFALAIWQQVNRWAENGEKDYGKQIFAMAAYLTPDCRQTLQEDINNRARRGELTLRTRVLGEVAGRGYDDSRVTAIGRGIWRVQLDTEVHEHVRGELVKHIYVRYPLRVVRYAFDPQTNPYGLAIDCSLSEEQPTRLEPADVGMAPPPVSKPTTVGQAGGGIIGK